MTTESELDELDREYYRSKLDELSWCLPVVRAAQVVMDELWSDDVEVPLSVMSKLLTLRNAIDAYNYQVKP